MLNISSKNNGWVTLPATAELYIIFLGIPGQMMIKFVVIKQSVLDQELSDTDCVQVPCLVVVVVVVVELKHKNFQDSPPCQVFSPGAGSAPTTVYQFLALHHRHH